MKHIRDVSRLPRQIVTGLLTYLSTGLLHPVHGHVKWFAPYDLERPPLRIDQVLTREYLYFFLGSVAFIYTFFLMDRYLYRRRFLSNAVERFVINPPLSLLILRAAAFITACTLEHRHGCGRTGSLR